jgi:hypothetical protein
LDSRFPAPPPVPGVMYVTVKPGDILLARVDEPFLFRVEPPAAVAAIRVTPFEQHMSWSAALLRAAEADSISDPDLKTVSGKEAKNIWNLTLSNKLLNGRIAGNLTDDWKNLLKKAASTTLFDWGLAFWNGEVLEQTRVTVADHAAFLLLREAFIDSMKRQAKSFPDLNDEAALRGFRELNQTRSWDDSSPWYHIRVTAPKGVNIVAFRRMVSSGMFLNVDHTYKDEVPMSYALSHSLLEEAFGKERKDEADRWSLQAIKEGLAIYKKAVDDSIATVGAIPDKDVKELIRVLGYIYEPLLHELLPRMMKLQAANPAPRQIWVPDYSARFSLRNLYTVVDAIRAQEDYSKLDTQMTLLAIAAATGGAGFAAGPGLVASCLSSGTAAVDLFVPLSADVSDYFQQRSDIHFALGASLILGTQHLNQQELQKTEWFQIALQNLPAAAGLPFAALEALPRINRAATWIRTTPLLEKVEANGWKAFQAMDESQKVGVLAALSEAKMLEATKAANTMDHLHLRAGKVADQLQAEIAAQKVVQNSKIPVVTIVEAKGSLQLPKEPQVPIKYSSATSAAQSPDATILEVTVPAPDQGATVAQNPSPTKNPSGQSTTIIENPPPAKNPSSLPPTVRETPPKSRQAGAGVDAATVKQGAGEATAPTQKAGVGQVNSRAEPDLVLSPPPLGPSKDPSSRLEYIFKQNQLRAANQADPIPVQTIAELLDGTTLVDGEGNRLEIGNIFSGGMFSVVGTVRDRPNLLFKLRFRGDGILNMSVQEMVNAAAEASKMLGDLGIGQYGVVWSSRKGPFPYLLVEKAPPGFQSFTFKEMKNMAALRSRPKMPWTVQHGNALVDEFIDMIKVDVIAEDLHVENVFWESQADGNLRCKIIDHDRIGKWGEKSGQRIVDFIEKPTTSEGEVLPYGRFLGIESLADQAPGTYKFKSAEDFMLRMLEHKRWIRYDKVRNAWTSERLDINYLRQKINLDQYLPKKTSQNVLPFLAVPEKLPTRMPAAEWMLDALAWRDSANWLDSEGRGLPRAA